MQAKVITIGNSKGVRLPSAALKKAGIKDGDLIEFTIRKPKSNAKEVVAAIRAIAESNGVLANLDAEAWEAERKRQLDERDQQLRDILRH